MNNLLRYALVAALSFAAAPALAQDAKKSPVQTGDAARPSDPTANKPSASGAQTTTPSGAVTGAGHPQGGAQPPQAQSADTPKAKPGTGAKAKKSAKKKKTRKQRAAKAGADTAADTAQSAR